MDQCRALQRLPRLFLGELLRCQFAQLIVEQPQDSAVACWSPLPTAFNSCVTSDMRSMIMRWNRLFHHVGSAPALA